jgi:hypothetical protein
MAKAFSQEIYEKRHEVRYSYESLQDLMTKEQYDRGQYYRDKYLTRRGEIQEYQEEWDMLQRMFACERKQSRADPTFPNNFIPLITPVVEGQVAAMLESDIEYTYTSNNPSHREYLPKIEGASKYCRNLNNAHLYYKDFARQYDLLGNAWMTVLWDKTYSTDKTKPQGYPRLMVPTLQSVLPDGRIKDFKDLQHCNYIFHEIGFQDIAWARTKYGDEKAEAIARCLNRYDGEDANALVDDNETFMLLHCWTRDNPQHKLELIEMDTTGFILEESFPYELVDNEYPFYFGRMIPRQGKFFGYGDGKILKYMQILINNLADEMELAARNNAQPKTFVDAEKGNLDMTQWDSDPSHPILMENPHQNVMALQGQGISQVVPQFIQFLLDQAQRATRFADIMTGNQQGVSATATQISGQLAQGSVGIKDKASDIQAMMKWCDRYCMRLCLQYWDTPFWISKFNNTDDAEFVDMSSMAKIPSVVPATGKIAQLRRKLRRKRPDLPVVSYEPVTKNGKPVYTMLDFDVDVKITAGFPKGKNDLFNQIISLMQIQVLDPKTGMSVPFLTTDIAREKMEQILGFKMTDARKEMNRAEQEQIVNAQGVNPLSNSGEVAQPQGSQIRTQPSNLMGTVPMARDNRSMQL